MAFQNFYATKLQTAIGASDTSIVVQTPPTALTGRLVLEPRSATQREIISYTGVSGTTLTGVTRGLFGTTAKPHSSGALTEMNFLAQDYQDLVDAYDSFVATNNDWRSLIQVPTIVSSDGQRQHKIRYTGVDYTGIIPVGAKLKIPRTGTTPTTSMAFVSASSQYASKSSPTGITFTDDFTCEAWVYLDSYPTSGVGTIMVRRTGVNTGFYFLVEADGRIQIKGGNGSSEDTFTTYQSLPLGKWTHVAGTLDISGAAGKLYVDGVDVPGTYVNGTATSLVQGGDLRIGADHAGANLFNGKIANARVWSTIRTAAQIRDNMNQETPASTTGLVAHFKGNGSWNDSSTNANHLTAVGGAVNNSATHPYSATEYAIATKVEYTGGNTDVTVFTGPSCLPNEVIGATSYATVRTPIGFPADKSLWTLKSLLRANKQVGSPTPGSFYEVEGLRLSYPVGNWIPSYNLHVQNERGSAGNTETWFGIVDTATTDPNASLILRGNVHDTDGSGGYLQIHQVDQKSPDAARVTTQSTKYITMKTGYGGQIGLTFRADRIDCVHAIECAYL